MIHLIIWLPLPYQRTLCRALYRVYGDDLAVWFAEREHKDFPYRLAPSEEFPCHYLSEEGYLKLFRALRADREAVVILGGWRSPMANKTLLMTKLLRIPVFIWADHPHPRKRQWLIARSRKIYLALLGRLVSGFLASGNPTVEHLASLGIEREKITNFPYWVELPQDWSIPERCLDEVTAKRPLRLLAIGRLVPVKQFEVAIEALAVTNQKAGDVVAELVIVGDGPEREPLEALTKSLGCETVVRFPGWLEIGEVGEELREADALVLTSRFDAFGVVVLEAMASGRPVMASEGVVAALDRDEGTGAVLLHPIGDIECLAEQIAFLATDRKRLGKASIAARATAEKWPSDRAITILDKALGRFHKGSGLSGRDKEHLVSHTTLKCGN